MFRWKPLFSVFFLILCFVPSGFGAAAPRQDHSESEVFPALNSEIIYADSVFQTATRSPQYVRRATHQVTVITREQLDAWPVSDLDEAIGYINGITVFDTGNMGQSATAQIDGSKAQEVRVLVDGITFNPTTTGGIADLSQIPLDIVEKIEVIKGPSSSAWGSATGGGINIITRPVGKTLIPTAEGTFSWGEYGTQRDRGELSGKAGPLSYYAFGSHAQSDGFRPAGKEMEKRTFFKAETALTDELKLLGSFGYSGTENGEFEFPLSASKFSRKVYSRYGKAGATWDPSDDWHHEAFYKISERKFRRDLRLLPSTDLFRFTKARSVIHEVSYQTVWELTEHQRIATGADIGVELLDASVFQFNVPGSAGTTRNSNRKSSLRQGYYTNYQYSRDSWDFNAAGRLDSTNSYGQNFDPSAGVAYHLPFYGTTLRGNVARAFNAPSLVDRYVSVGTVIANPDLKAEKSVGYNLGMETSPVSWLHGKGFFFQTFLEDSIQTVRRTDGFLQPTNLSSERRTGFETETWTDSWWGFSPSYGTTYVVAEDPGKGPVQGRPRWTQDVKLNYRKAIKEFIFNSNLAGRYTDVVTGYGTTDPTDRVFVFDGKMVLTLPPFCRSRLSLFLLGNNLLNEDFSLDTGNFPNPKRNFEAGFKVRVA